MQYQQKLELLPPPNCMDDQDGPREQDVSGLFWTFSGFVELSKHLAR